MLMMVVFVLEVCWRSQHVGSHCSASLTCCVKSAAASLDLQVCMRMDAHPECDCNPTWVVTSLPCLWSSGCSIPQSQCSKWQAVTLRIVCGHLWQTGSGGRAQGVVVAALGNRRLLGLGCCDECCMLDIQSGL